MAFTYDVTTDRGKVRLLIGDTNSLDPLLADAEIDYFLTTYSSNIKISAIHAARAIAASLAREPDKKVGDLSLSNSQRAKAYLDLAATLEKSAYAVVTGWAGGQSKSEKDTNANTDDLVKPFAKRDDMSYDGPNYDDEDDD